jgi:hypothetical protein
MIIYQAPKSSVAAREAEQPPVIERRADERNVPADLRRTRADEDVEPVPVMRAEPVRPQQRSRATAARDSADEDVPVLSAAPADAAEDQGSRPRGRVKRRIIKTRVFSDGHQEQEVIEER